MPNTVFSGLTPLLLSVEHIYLEKVSYGFEFMRIIKLEIVLGGHAGQTAKETVRHELPVMTLLAKPQSMKSDGLMMPNIAQAFWLASFFLSSFFPFSFLLSFLPLNVG